MNFFAAPVARLIEEFEKLPGIGNKTAQRLAYYMLNIPKDSAISFAKRSLTCSAVNSPRSFTLQHSGAWAETSMTRFHTASSRL